MVVRNQLDSLGLLPLEMLDVRFWGAGAGFLEILDFVEVFFVTHLELPFELFDDFAVT